MHSYLPSVSPPTLTTMGNLHSYYGDVTSSSSAPSSASSSGSSPHDSSSDEHWEHRLDQHTYRPLFVNHHKRLVSPHHPAFISANQPLAVPSSPSLDLLFAELPPTAYSHGVHRDVVGLLSQSTPFVTPHSPAFLRLVSASTTRLSRQLHELVYHHINQRLLHAITSSEQLQRVQTQQSKQQLTFAYSLVLPPSASSPTPTVEERDEHAKQSQAHVKQLVSKAGGKAGRRLLTSAVLDAIEKAGGVGSLLPVAEDRPVKELSAALQAAAHEQLNKDELTALIRSSLALALRTTIHAHVMAALSSIASSLRLYGDMRLPMFSALTRYSHEVVPLVLAMCKEGTADDKAWKAAAMSRVQDAFGLLTMNDREKERERDKEREHVAFSYTLAFLLAHLAVLAETYNRHHITSMQSITGQCNTVPHYSLLNAPLILDSSPESAVQLVDLLTTLSHLRPEPSLPTTYKRMYASIRSLFPPSPRHANSVQCVRLLLPLLSSLLTTPGSLMCRQFKYGRDGPFYECVEEWQERKDILLLIGFQIVARKKGKPAGEERKEASVTSGGAEELEWYADEQQLDLPLLRYAVQQLTRLNAAYYEQRPAKSPLDTITASSALSTAILSLLSLLRTWLLTVRANRISSALLTRPDLFCSQRQPLLIGSVDVLLQLLGKDDSEYSTSDEDRAVEREKACELMSLLFPLLPSQQQLRVLHHSVLSTPLRQSILRLLTVEPMCFSLFPSVHSSSSSATVWERIAKGVDKSNRSMGSLLTDPAVVSWLIDCHDQGAFHVKKHEREAGGALGARAMKGNVKTMYDWLSKSSLSGGGEDGAMGNTAELASTPPSQSPVLSSGPLSEEKKETIAESQMALPATAMPSPPLLSYTRSMSALPFVDSADVNDFHSLLDLFYYYLTSSSSTPSASIRSDIQLLMLHIERCLLVRTLIPLNTYDRTHTPLLLSSYASSLLHHTNEFITTLRHGSAAQSTQSAAPMTSLTPSFPSKLPLPASYQSDLFQSPFCFLLSSFVLPFSYICSLSRLALPLDEQLLSSLHQLMAQCGGYGGLDDESQLREWADKEEQRHGGGVLPSHTLYSQLHDYVSVSNVLVDVVSGEGDKALNEVIERLGEKGKAFQGGLVRVHEERSVHHASVELLHVLDDHAFAGETANEEERTANKALFHSRIALPSLYVCITCGTTCSTPSALLRHTARSGDSICCSASALFSLLQQSVLWLLAKVSRHMAAACPAASGAHAPAVRDKAKDADERERPLTGVEDIGGPTLPRTVDQWLNSELMKTGLEDYYVSAPSASILPPLAVSATSSFAPSLAVSMPGTPKGRSIPLTGGVSTEPSQLLFGGEMTLPQQSSLFAPSTQQHSMLTISTLDYENNKTSPTAAASSSSSAAALPPLQLYEKSDSEKLLADDLASKGSVTIESPRGGVTLSLQLLTGGAERDGGKDMGGVYGEKADGFSGRVGVSLVATEPYEHAHWLRDLIYGDGEAGELDVAVMAHVTMRLFVQKRRMAGPKAVEASRAVIAALLKHTNKMELALDEFSLWQDDTQHAFSPSLLKAWKQGGELLTDMIAAHQQGMQYLCATKGCECEASETHEVTGKEKFKCTAGHVNERCVERDTQPYEAMAERVMSNCQFLLKLRPSLASSTQLQLQRLNSMRVRKILRVRPPLPSASPEPSPQYENESVSRQARQRRERERPIRLKPQPQLTWSTTSAAAHQLIVPNVPLSPLSAPLPSKRKTTDDGSGAAAGGVDELTPPSIYTPEQQQRVMRRGSVGTIPPQIDDSLAQRQISGGHSRQVKRDKIKAAVKRELQAQRWKELREELLLSRNSFVSLFSRVPLSALVLSFAKDFTTATVQQVERLDFALRSAVLRAERRVKGLESLCLLMKNGAVGAKMLALTELNVVVRVWSCEKDKHDSLHKRDSHTAPQKGEKPAEMSSASFFPPATTAAAASSALTPLPLKPLRFHRFDDNVLTCGSARLSMICDAFYVLSGVNVNLMRQCINVLLTTAIAGGECSERRDRGEARLELINSERAAADVDPSPLPSSRTPSPTPPPFASPSIGGLSCSSALSLLLGCLHCWHVSFHRSDFTFLRNTGILSVIDMLVQSYPALPLSATSPLPLPLQPDDLIKVREIGRKSRAVYRLLVLSCLTQEEVTTKAGEEDDEHDREPSLSDAHGGGDRKEEEGIAVDSFEAMLLNSSFSRLEVIVSRIQQRGLKQQRQKVDEDEDAEDEDDAEELPAGGSRRLNQRSIRAQLTSFTLAPEQQAQQDEADCDELLSVLLLSCASARIRLSLTHSPADSTPPSPQLLSPFSSFSLPLSARCLYLLLNLLSSTSFTALSTRCIRHTLRLCQQLLPLLTPATVDAVFMHQLDSVSDDEDDVSTHSPFVNHLLASIGYFTCGRFLTRATFTSSSSHSQTVAAELTALLRLLSCSSSWHPTIALAVAQSLRHIKHRQFSLTDDAARITFYRCWGALAVLGAGNEDARVGARVQIHRVSKRNEKLSKEPHLEDEANAVRVGTVVGRLHHQLLVVEDGDRSFTPQAVSVTQCDFVPIVPCLHPIHTGVHGQSNMTAVVSYINQAFSSSTTPNAVFALYPPTLHAGDADSRDQQINYIHSLLKVWSVKVLCFAISHSLTIGSPHSVLLQSILRDSSTSTTVNTLMSNLLSIAQNVIPLTQGVGQLAPLEHKQLALHAILHDRTLPPVVPSELKQLSIHVDLCHRALSLFPGNTAGAVNWLKGKHIQIKLEESAAKRDTTPDVLRSLQDMGFSAPLCAKALMLCNGDSNQAVNWLVEHGMAEMDSARNGVVTDSWGLEGVDFYQEKVRPRFTPPSFACCILASLVLICRILLLLSCRAGPLDTGALSRCGR